VQYFAIGDEDTILGFSLAGVRGRIARNAGEATEAFREALGRPDAGIVIMTERVVAMIRAEVEAYMFSERFPLVVEIPDRTGRLAGRPGIRDLVNQAIGIKL